jgi:hypothetical protein
MSEGLTRREALGAMLGGALSLTLLPGEADAACSITKTDATNCIGALPAQTEKSSMTAGAKKLVEENWKGTITGDTITIPGLNRKVEPAGHDSVTMVMAETVNGQPTLIVRDTNFLHNGVRGTRLRFIQKNPASGQMGDANFFYPNK